jgi:hypothetical protein
MNVAFGRSGFHETSSTRNFSRHGSALRKRVEQIKMTLNAQSPDISPTGRFSAASVSREIFLQRLGRMN